MGTKSSPPCPSSLPTDFKMTMFSVIVTVHNREKYLRKCIDSILANISENYELILVDDGSTDNSGTICNHYASQFNHVRNIHTDNLGVANARNIALNMAVGEYVLFVDDDDEWATSFSLSHLEEYILHTQTDLVVFGIIIRKIELSTKVEQFLKIERSYLKNWREQQQLFLCQFTNGLMFSCCNKVFKRKVILSNQIKFIQQQMEDFRFVLEYLNVVKSVTFQPSLLYIYNKSTDDASLTKSICPTMLKDYNQCHQLFLSMFANKYANEIHQIMAPQYIATANRHLSLLGTHEFRKFAKEALHNIGGNKLFKLAISTYSTHTLSEKITFFLMSHGLFSILQVYRRLIKGFKYFI